MPGEHAGVVGHVHRHALKRSGVGVRVDQHPAPVLRRLGDPARQRATVALREPPLELLDTPAVLGQRLGSSGPLSRKMSTQMRGFAPATRVMSRSDPPAAASGSWPSIRPDAGLVDEQVGERMRQVAGQRDEPVVRARVDRHRQGAERGDEAVDEPVALGIDTGERVRNQVAPVEQIGGRVGSARAPHGRRPDGRRRTGRGSRSDQSFVEPTSVTVQPSGARASTSSTSCGRVGDRRGDERELRVGEHFLRATQRAGRPPRARRQLPARPRRGPQPETTAAPARLAAKPDGGPHQAGADDREGGGRRHYDTSCCRPPCMRSARSNARSRAWSAFSLGSQSDP